MRTITYEQHWPLEVWYGVADWRTLATSPEIAWLQAQGYQTAESEVSLDFDREWIQVRYEFRVPDEIMTWVILQWPAPVTTHDVDQDK